MKNLAPIVLLASVAACSSGTNPAAERQAQATRQLADEADRQIGMPRVTNFAQRRTLARAYEDMDRTLLTFAYTQDLSGKFVCLGQAIGYGIGLGTQFTSPTYPQRIRVPYNSDGDTSSTGAEVYEQAQPEPNGLYMPDAAPATAIALINPANGEARIAIIEQNLLTVPFELPAQAVSVPCPPAVAADRVRDVRGADQVRQR